MENVIEVNGLCKVYKKNFRKIHALKGIGFTVRKNMILGILGPNGAGKTTLLKLLTGIMAPERGMGTLALLGTEDIATVKHRIGFLPENPEFFRNISAYELLVFAQRVSGIQHDREKIYRVLRQVRLFDERRERVRNFSKGMRQRIGIAQAIIHEPELLILDEPMSGLDPPGRRMVTDIIEDYAKLGRTILFSTHDLDDIEALCTDVMVLKEGEILLEKSLAQLRLGSRFLIQAENREGKFSQVAKDTEELWRMLENIRNKGMRIIKVQSGIADHLELFYGQETDDES